MVFRTEDKSRKGRGTRAKRAASAGVDLDNSELTAKANGERAMSQGKEQQAATKANLLDADALSLDELDQVVGGGGGTQTQNSEMPPHEGGYTPPPPPVVHAPSNLPDSINQVEQAVAVNHTINPDQAISQIAGIIGGGNAHDIHTQQAAGAEIASLIGRGIIDANTAITDLHTAVTQTQSMTGTEAAGVLAGMVAAQYTTPGESQTISNGAVTEVTNLINSGALDPHEAITAFASLAGSTQAAIPLVLDINTIAHASNLSALQVATDIGNAVVDGALTGQQAVSVLAGIAMDWTGTTNMLTAAGHEIADLVTNHGVAPADAMAGITAAYYQGDMLVSQMPGLLLSAVDANPALADAAGAELATIGVATNTFESAVTSLGISADTAAELMLAATQHGAQGFSASQIVVDLVENNTWSMTQAMTAIENHTTSANADAAVGLLLGVATNGGYGATFEPAAEAALVTMIHNGQIDAARAANDIAPNLTTQIYSYANSGFMQAVNDPFYGFQTLHMLMAIATAGTSDAVSGVTAALDGLVTAHNNGTGGCAPMDLLTGLAHSVGSYGAANPARDAATTNAISHLVTTGAVDANAAIEVISNAMVLGAPASGKPALCNEIIAIAQIANLTPAQVVADVMANPPQSTNATPDVVLAMLAGHGSQWQAAAVPALLGMIGGWAYPTGDDMASWLPSLLLTYNQPVDNIVSLLTALVGDGSTAVSPAAAGAEVATLIGGNHISATQAMADIHAAVVNGQLGGDAALKLLANVATNSVGAQPAVNLELRALVAGASPIIPGGHATDVLNALLADAQSANNAALAAVLTAELTVLASSDPAVAIFQGLGTTTSDTDLDGAATQLSAMIASGASTTAHVMNDIDQAYANGTLTPLQASSLLVDIAAHAPGNMTAQAALAVQVAAGAEFAKVLSASNGAGVAMFPGGSATPNDPPWGSVAGILGLGVGGYLSITHPNVMTATLTTEGMAAFLAGGLGSNAISEITRTAFEIAATGSVGYGSTFFNANSTLPAPVNGLSLTQAFNDIAAAHAMPGPELIRAVYVLGNGISFNAGQELQTLMLNQSVSMADVNTAITSGAWQLDNAVQVLTSISSMPGALTEINSLLAANTISAANLISDLHDGLTGGARHGQALFASNVADVLGMLAASSDTNTLTLVGNEIVTDITHGLLPIANVAAILTASGANQPALVDQILGHLGSLSGQDAGTLLGQMITANLTTFDHVFGLTGGATPVLSMDALASAMQWAVTYDNTLTADQVGAGVAVALTDGTLTAAQAMSIVINWADTAIGPVVSLAGQVMAAAVATGQISADQAMQQLTSNANALAHTQFGGVGINVPAMTQLLNSFVAHTDPASVMAACTETRTLVAYNFFPADNGLALMAGFANYANAAGLQAIGENFSGMLHNGQGSLYEIGTLLANAGVTGAHAMSVFAGIAEGAASNGDASIVTGALAQITTLTQAGGATTQDAFAALCGVAGSMAATLHSSLMQAVAAQMQTLVLADLSALAGMGAAITGQTLTSAQAAGLLLGMMPNSGDASQGLPAALLAEVNTLIGGHLMTSTDFLQAVGNSVNVTHTLSADSAINILANCWPNADATFAAQIAGTMITMIQGGQINANQVVYDLNGTINHPLSVDQVVGLMTALSSPNTQLGTTLSGAVAADLLSILGQGGAVMTVDQVIAGIDHALTNHGVDAANAVTLLAQLANGTMGAQGSLWLMSAAAAQEIVSLIGNNAIGAPSALTYVSWVTANAPDHGVTFMMDIAAHSTPACQIAFGSIIANLVGNGTITASQAVGYVSSAYAAYQQNPVLQDAVHTSGPSYRVFQPGNVTAAQELGLLAGILAGVNSPGHLDASALIAPVHAELLAAMQAPPYRATDVQVAAALEAVGVNSAQIQAAVNTEIAALENDVGPKMLIDVAHTTGADMSAVGGQLTALIAQGRASVGEVMNDIVAAAQAGNLSNSEALTMIVSSVANTTSNGIYVSATTASDTNNWLVSTAGALETLAQRGLSPTAITDAIQGIAGLGPSLLYPDDAVSMLASLGAYPDMQANAASHISSMLANSSFNLYGESIVNDVARCVSPLHLQAADAVHLLGLVATTNPSPTLYGQIADGLASQHVITPDAVVNTIEGMVQSGAMTGQQALHFLVPYGPAATGLVGHAVGDLIVSNQVSMADFKALIAGPSANYWQQVVGTGNIDFTDAMLVLTAMTSRTAAAVTELATMASNGTGGFALEQQLVNAGEHPTVSGPTPIEVVRALVTLTLDPNAARVYGTYSATQIQGDINAIVIANAGSSLPAAYHISMNDAQGEVMALAVNSTPALEQGATALLNVMLGGAPAGGPDGILSAIGHGITADQAVTLLTAISASQPSLDFGPNMVPTSLVQQVTNTLSHARADIAYLIANGQLTGSQALADVHNACMANNIGAGQELSMLAGIFEQSGGSAVVQTAVAQQIDSLIGSGRFNLQQAMDAIAGGTYLPNTFQPMPTQGQTIASFVAGGLDSSASAALMALVAANSTDPAAPSIAASELAGMIAGLRIDAGQAMSGIDAAVAAGTLDAARAVVILANTPLSASDSVHATIGGELASLVTNNRITLDNAVAALVGMAHQGSATQQLEAGAALGLLVAQNALNASTAIADIHAAAQSGTLTADQAVAMLAGITADPAAGVASAAATEIAWQIAHGEPVANALSLLLNAAEHGPASMQAGAGVIMGTLISQNVVTAAQAVQSIDTAFTSGALPAAMATNMLLNIAGANNAAVQVAMGQEIGHVLQIANSATGLNTQLAASNLSQDQAVTVLTAAIGNTSASMGTPLASLIIGMVNSGPIGIGQVLSDIDAAVASSTLTGSQAMVVLAHLEEAAPNTMRMAVVNEAVALVSNGRISGTDAAQALLAAAHGGSIAQQSLSGGILAALAQNNLLTNQQVVDAVNNTATLSGSEALGVLMGMSVNGNAAAQAAAGFGILSLVDHNRVDASYVISFLDTQARAGMVTMAHAIDTLVAIMGATITNGDLQGSTFYDQIPAEIISLTTSASFAQWNSQTSLTGVLVQCAGGSIGMAEAVGRVFSALFYADVTTARNQLLDTGPRLDATLAAAVTANTLSADQAVMVALIGQANGQAVVLPGLISSGAVTADQVMHLLVTQAVRIGDSDSYAPSAFNGLGGAWTERDLTVPMIEAMHSLISGSQISMTAAVNDILAEVTQAHDVSPMQAAQLLAALAGRVGGADAITAAGGIATLVSQGQLDNENGMHAIGWMVGQNIDPALSHLMFASFALNASPAVQQMAFWAFNENGAVLAADFHAIATSPLFTHDQALTILTTIAAGVSSLSAASGVVGVLAGEITTMVTSHQITADHAVSVLATLAASSSFHLNALSVEMNALIAANAITFGQVVNDLLQSPLNVNQVVTTLVGLCTANSTFDSPVYGQITSMINSGAITAAQAMADIGQASPDVAVRLLTPFAGASAAIEDAAAAELATLFMQSGSSIPAAIYNFYTYAKAHWDAVHAFGWIVSVAAHGNDALKTFVDTQLQWDRTTNAYDVAGCLTSFVANYTPSVLIQYYIGQELGRLIDHTTNAPPAVVIQNVMAVVEQSIVGTDARNYVSTVPGATAANIPKALSSDSAALVMLGLSNSTHNADVQAAATKDFNQVSHTVDQQFFASVAQVLPPEQALAQFANFVAHDQVNVNVVAKQVADMLAAGTVTAAQVLAAFAPLDTTHQLAVMTDILLQHEANSQALTSQFANLVLLSWGVAQTSPVYNQMHEALALVVPDFVGLARGTSTATQVMNDIRGIATSHGISADVLLLVAVHAANQDLGVAGSNLTNVGHALQTIGGELYTHLSDGSAAQAVANMVTSGMVSESEAATLIQQLVGSASLPLTDIQTQVRDGTMSVWYADANHPGWQSHGMDAAFTLTQATAMMHVDVHVTQDAAAVLAGTMTAQAAVDDVLAAGGASPYAQDVGLLALAHDFANAPQLVQETVGFAMTARLASGASELAVVDMAAHGWLPAQDAINMVIRETQIANAGVDPDTAAAFSALALARLDLAASGQVDPNATVADQAAHAHVTSGAIQTLLESQQGARVLFGLGTLQTLGNDTYQNGASLALAQHMMGVVISQLTDQGAATSSSSTLPDWMGSMPPAAQQAVHYADMAMQIFVLGIGTAGVLNILGEHYSGVATVLNYMSPGTQLIEHGPQLLQLAVAHYAPATDVYALTQNDKSVQNWVNLGVDCAVSGVPLAGQLGLPSPLGGIQSNVLNSVLGEGAGGTFLAVNIGSHVALAVLEMGVVQNYFHDHPAVGLIGNTVTAMLGVVAESCSMISGMISGACHVEANMLLAVGTETVDTFKDIFTHQDAAADATQLGKAIFAVWTMGGNFDDYAQLGDDVGNAMVDIFTGHPQNLGGDIEAIGKDYLDTITHNQFIQMGANVAYTYLQKLDDILGNPSQHYTSDGLKQFLGLPQDVSWGTMFEGTGDMIGDAIKDGFDDAGNALKSY
jgi:hypothetical protein